MLSKTQEELITAVRQHAVSLGTARALHTHQKPPPLILNQTHLTPDNAILMNPFSLPHFCTVVRNGIRSTKNYN